MSIVQRTVVLTGARAGQTCVLNHGRFRFTNGKLRLRGDGDRIAGLMKILADQYQAYEEGSDELEAARGQCDLQTTSEPSDAKPPVRGGVQPDGQGPSPEAADDVPAGDDTDAGEEGLRADGSGHEDPRLHAVQEALSQLSHDDDAHWTTLGLPKVAVVAELSGIEDVSRREIETAVPDFKRME